MKTERVEGERTAFVAGATFAHFWGWRGVGREGALL